MYARRINPHQEASFFLFGPRGTGKSSWLRLAFPDACFIDLLEAENYNRLLANPGYLSSLIPAAHRGWVILDEVQRVPEILNEVHRLIEKKRLRFALTGSSARKLRARGVNLLAGRARTLRMHPLTVGELGADFNLKKSLATGHLPEAYASEHPRAFLASYVQTYLREEVQQEGLTRNLGAFSRFLETISFSQGSALNLSEIARDAAVERKVVENYVSILEDLLLAERVPSFTRRAKRRLVAHPKFYLFDCGVFQTIRPKGPLDTPEELQGAALETLVFQELSAQNDYDDLGYKIHYWRTSTGDEVDFVLYGENGLLAIEVKRSGTLREKDFSGLRRFREDYPEARAYLVHPSAGKVEREIGGIRQISLEHFLVTLPRILAPRKGK